MPLCSRSSQAERSVRAWWRRRGARSTRAEGTHHQRHSIDGETQTLNALRATVEDGSGPMNTFCLAPGVDLALTDHAYALAALSWWWATRVAGPGLC